MQKASATYRAPDGDAKSVTIGGVIFNDGEAVNINSDDHPHLMEKLRSNQHFEFEAGEDDQKPRRGRPPTRDLKAGMAEATGHDFEKDRQDGIAERDRRNDKAADNRPA